MMQVAGLNIREVWRHCQLFDVNSLKCNDVYAMLQNYGVEAARNAVIEELTAVFSVYGIAVNHRHLSLVADYMVSRRQGIVCCPPSAPALSRVPNGHRLVVSEPETVVCAAPY